jgi:hypothetical protein
VRTSTTASPSAGRTFRIIESLLLAMLHWSAARVPLLPWGGS